MPLTLQEIEVEARKLSEDEREILIQSLMAGLEPELNDKEIDRLWIEEAERRYQDIIDGKTKTIPAEQAFAEIRARLNANRRV